MDTETHRGAKDRATNNPRWKEVADALSQAAAGPSPEQLALAKFQGLSDVSSTTPGPVVSVLLRRSLNSALGTSYRRQEASDGALEYLADMARQVGRRVPETYDKALVEAWVEVFWGIRAARALRRLKPNIGDVVARQSDGATFVVSSIAESGQIHFRGSPGQRTRPHLLTIVSRKGSRSYPELKYRADQEAASRKSVSSVPGTAALASMSGWQVIGSPGHLEQNALVDALENARDEKPLQAVLERHPELLAHLSPGTQGTWVVSQKALGSQHVPDFLIATLTSAGLVWTLVELESPTAPLTIGDGQAEKRVRKGMKQITDWREWLGENIDYARKVGNGIGLINIRADAQGLLLVGRGDPTAAVDPMRARARAEHRIEIRTYDWLVRAARANRVGGYGPLDQEISSRRFDEYE